MTRLRPRRVAAALGLVCALGCAASDERLIVTGRIGPPDGRATTPELAAAERTLGVATRDAVVAPPDAAFEVSVEPGDRRLLFSLAPLAAGCGAPVAFSVTGRFGASWQPLFEERVEPGEPRWLDRAVDIDGERGRPSALRFVADAGPAGRAASDACPDPKPTWGSIVFLGHDRWGWLLPRPSPPNVLLVSLDTLGAAYLGSFDNIPEVSPHLDAFLASSFSFRRAYAQYGYTLPSHASLFTGLYPAHHHVYRPDPSTRFDSLVGEFARQGYVTAAFTEGAMVSASFGFAGGFDWYHEGTRNAAEALAGRADRTFGRAGDWLERVGRDTRFFLFLHTYEVHLPYIPRDRESRQLARRLSPGVARFFDATAQAVSTSLHNRGKKQLSARELKHLRALHSAEINYLDRIVESLLQRIAALGLERDTLVVLTADHGDQFGEHGKVSHGESLHNLVLHVPLGFRWPGVVEPGVGEMPVQLVDVMPTVFDLAGLPTPEGLDGRSLAPLMRGQELEPRPAFSEQRTGIGECIRLDQKAWCQLDRFAVQTDRFKLTTSRVPPGEVLYDLAADPLETRDVAAEHPEELERLRGLLASYTRDAPQEIPAPRGPPPPIDENLRVLLERLGYGE